jgi:NAD(P)-dependent dehydrogenase (short-subunit alcohol dehydrogenase family)
VSSKRPLPLQDRVVLITGATSGLGEAAARACARDGARLALAARREDRLRLLVEELERDGRTALALRTDMRDTEAIRAMASATLERWGQIDALVANAGVGHTVRVSEITEEQLQEQVEVNLLGVIRSARAVLPAMRIAGGGHILAVASVAAGCIMPGSAVYGATKAGVVAFCEGLRREVARDGIAVTAILPGFIATPMTVGHPFPMPPASVVGEAIARLIRRPRQRVVIPAWYAPLMTINRVAPGLLDAISRRGTAP